MPPGVLGWEAAHGSAARLAERLAGNGDPSAQAAAEKAALAALIAGRHMGMGSRIALPDDAALAALPRPLRFRLLAHVVQSAADGSDEVETRRSLEVAARMLPPPKERSADELRLTGAGGRALAALGSYREARTWLDEAVQGWASIHGEQHASHPLCELVRVLGVLGSSGGDGAPREAIHGLLARELPAVMSHPEVTDESLGFLRLAAGRALAQVGEPERALDLLRDGELDWGLFPAHLSNGRLRWRARAHDARGERDAAARERGGLDRADVEQSRLADLDEAIRDDAGASVMAEILAALRADPFASAELDRLSRRFPTADTSAFARFVAEHYRY